MHESSPIRTASSGCINTASGGEGARTQILGYVAYSYGTTISKVDKWFPSSQLCCECGFRNEATKDLSVREWDCPNCGAHHDRDRNAAKNILREGLRILEM